ncbi:uncharacterized protein B0H18DRAFT_981862 [Fomitopsis serialis]|uniref:uncharacterized protein n=1 Tax=Fomitopsis serialis TaxID=139415 RepID=UPI002008558A|nr:uncharacterized protein B0H18DRAFT_981862 [Neoantrodia serialis]KAH9933749.1 hypothetical protein B0H18DRAFT_981862 [Neoantrodia serialis]
MKEKEAQAKEAQEILQIRQMELSDIQAKLAEKKRTRMREEGEGPNKRMKSLSPIHAEPYHGDVIDLTMD